MPAADPTTDRPTVDEPSSRLAREWTACALVRAATRFLPVPLLDEMDLRLLRGAVSDGLGQVKHVIDAVVDHAEDRFGGTGDDDDVPEPDGAVAEGTERVERGLRQPEVVQLLQEFDRRMDERLAGCADGRRCAGRPVLRRFHGAHGPRRTTAPPAREPPRPPPGRPW